MGDEQLKEAGVTLVGHRKRLIQAGKELALPPVLGIEGVAMAAQEVASSSKEVTMEDVSDTENQADQEQRRFNSTSSIFIQSTITKPDIDEIIFCVAVVIHDRIVQGETTGSEERSKFPYFSE